MVRTYIYCPRGSDGAFGLVKGLPATRLRRFDGINFWDKRVRVEPENGSVIICWGATVPDLDGMRVLNSLDRQLNKLQEVKRLIKAKVPTIAVIDNGQGYTEMQLRDANYMPRSFYHQGGTDLLGMEKRVDYWVQREQFVHEYRIHSFAGKSIRAGQKILREGLKIGTEGDWVLNGKWAHPWIRSWDGGWKISYNGFKSTDKMRVLAHTAVKAVGLTFGAVDLGELANGGLKVLEVNSAPGIENNTIDAYIRAINRWIKDDPKAVDEE